MKMRARAVAIAVMVMATVPVLWFALTCGIADGRRGDEMAIRALLRDLERDLQNDRVLEIFTHLAHVDRSQRSHEGREHVLMDSLRDLSEIEEFQFSDAEIAFSSEGAMVDVKVTGYVETSGGIRKFVSRRILLQLVKEADDWKIANKKPEGAIHELRPLWKDGSSALGPLGGEPRQKSSAGALFSSGGGLELA